MRRSRRDWFFRTLGVCLLMAASVAVGLSMPARADESGETLIADVIRRARASRKAPATYEFTRTKTTLFYASEKEVSSEEKKVYRVTPINGKLRSKLVSVNDAPPPPRPVRGNPSSGGEPKKTGRSERGVGADSILSQISDDAVGRFDYAVVAREVQAGRSTLVIQVKPKQGLKARTLEEEVMAQLAGKIWVDELEHEVVKVDIALQEAVKVGWGGMLGALREFRLAVERSRHATGEWINASSDVWIHFRQLFTSKRIRLKETVTDIRPLNSASPSVESK